VSRQGTALTRERIRSGRQADAGLHPGAAAAVVGLEVEAVVEAAVDPLRGRAAGIAAPP